MLIMGWLPDHAGWPKAANSYELEPRKGYVRFFRTFFVLHCILFHLAPSPAIEGASGKGCFHFVDNPTAAGLRSYSYSSQGRHTRLPTGESSYSQERRPVGRRQFVAQDTLGIRPAIGLLLSRLLTRMFHRGRQARLSAQMRIWYIVI